MPNINYYLKKYVLSLWSNRKLGQKYSMAFVVSLLIFSISTCIVFELLKNIEKDTELLKDKNNLILQLAEMGTVMIEKDLSVADYVHLKDPNELYTLKGKQRVLTLLEKRISASLNKGQDQKIFSKIIANDRTIDQDFMNQLKEAINNDNVAKAMELRERMSLMRKKNAILLQQVSDHIVQQQKAVSESVKMRLMQTLIFLVGSVLLSIVLGTAIIILINRIVHKRLTKVVQLTHCIANGELDILVEKSKGKDEINQILSAVIDMKNKLREMVKQVIATSRELKTNGEALKNALFEVTSNNSQLAATFVNMSEGAEKQASQTKAISNILKEYNELVLQTNQQGLNMYERSKMIKGTTKDGRVLMDRSVQEIEQTSHLVMSTHSQIHILQYKVNEISELTQVINHISNETNLLSLNAAIEAARAGEHGAGFGVVANEIKKLSDSVSQSVGKIAGIIDSIQKETSDVTASLGAGAKQVALSKEELYKTKDGYSTIENNVNQMIEDVQGMSAQLQVIQKNSHRVNGAVEEVAQITEQSSENIDESSSSLQEIHSVLAIVAKNTEDLSTLATTLETQAEHFKIDFK